MKTVYIVVRVLAISAVLGFAACSSMPDAHATSYRQVSLEEIVQRHAVIVIGTVQGITEPGDDALRETYETGHIRISKVLKLNKADIDNAFVLRLIVPG